MELGFLTSPFSNEPLERVVEFANKSGFQALEVDAPPGGKQIDPLTLTKPRADEIKKLLSKSGVRISSLAWYTNALEPDKNARAQRIKELHTMIEAAAMLGVDTICTFAGMPLPGKSRIQTLEEDYAGVFGPLAEFAAGKGVKIAFENWAATNMQHLDIWKRVFELVPNENVGLNFDPSHLYWQGIDYLQAVDEFAPRIFHTHAKDCEVKQHVLRRIGNQEWGWWRYVIPGYGEINWGVYIARLRKAGYNGVLSIEHEDEAFGSEEGMIKGQRYLSQFI